MSSPRYSTKDIIILGIGNPILSDDGVGIHVLRKLRPLLKETGIVLEEAYTGGMPLVDLMKGYTKSILVDAITLPGEKNGTIKRLSLPDLPTSHSCNPHDLSLPAAIQLAEQMGEMIPKEIIIIGIVVNTPPIFGEQLTPQIRKSIPKAVELVLTEVATPVSP